MREFVAYLLSAVLHASVLGVLNSALDEPPQLLRVELGRASVESALSHEAQPIGVVDPDTALINEVTDGARTKAPPEQIEAEDLKVTRQQSWQAIARRRGPDGRDFEDSAPGRPSETCRA